jgi:putative transposase
MNVRKICGWPIPDHSAQPPGGPRMRPSKFTQDQIVQALRQVRGGTPAVHLCRKLGITETTFYRWRSKYDAPAVGASRELRELRDENQKLKEIVANLVLDKQRLADNSGRR